jgi:Fe-S-cluster containining protein
MGTPPEAETPTSLRDREAARRDLVRFHDEVERDATRLAARHRERLQCRRGCADCCVDELTVFEVEAERIRSAAARLLEEGTPHPAGACAFLGRDGACRIYADRPYVCRTQGLPLRWIEERADGVPVEFRDICPLNEEGPLVEALDEDACWTLGPAEGRLAAIQQAFGGDLKRVRLRDLFWRRT